MSHSISTVDSIDFLFAHVPKRSSYYKLFDEFVSINYIPMGVFGLCDQLNKNGIKSRIKHVGLETIIDDTFSIAKFIKDRDIKIVGMSLHWHYQSYDVIDVAEKIKTLSPDTIIVLGGFTATRFAVEILGKYPCIDFIIKGDAEKGLLELVQAIKSSSKEFSTVANCVWRSGDGVIGNSITFSADTESIESLDFASLHYLDHNTEYRTFFKAPFTWSVNASRKENLGKKVGGASNVFPLMIGRGCPVNCSFCGGSRDAQVLLCRRKKPFFLRSIQSIVDTMEKAISFGYDSFIVCFDPMPHNDTFYIEVFKEVRKRKLICGMGFESWGLPTQRFIQEFSKTFDPRSSYIALSPETGSEEIRKRNKGFFYTNQQFTEVMQWIETEGIQSVVYLTIGLPGENSSHIEETYKFSKEIRKKFHKSLDCILLLPVQIEPGAPMFENPSQYGIDSERSCFEDFYKFHSRADSNPYTFFGYVSDSLKEANDNVATFSEYLCRKRCDKFCMVNIKVFGRLLPNAIVKKLCFLRHKSWKRKGFGAPPAVRKAYC
jgi:radical SAM superfamily enzyme YgiQ (UPF0313 family)